MWETRGVLLGVAEVKLPLRRLPEEQQVKVVEEIYGAVTEPPDDEEKKDEELRRRAVGEVDTFYAMQDVVLEEEDKQCVLRCPKETILQFKLTDVMYAGTVGGTESQMIFVTRSENFGRAAVILQMLNALAAQELITKMAHTLKRPVSVSEETMRAEAVESEGEMKTDSPKLISRLTSLFSGVQVRERVVESKSCDHSRNSQLSDGSSDDNTSWDTTENTDDTLDIPVPQSVPEVPLPKPDPEDLIKAEIDYILGTESRYSKMLITLEEDRNQLSKISPPFFRKWLSQLFRQIRPLSKTHQTLLANLTASGYNIDKFCQSFLDLRKQLYNYIFYIENIPTVDKLLTEYSSFLQEKKPGLTDKLRQPRLRLNHYVLMLESLQKKVTAGQKFHLQETIDMCKMYLKEADKSLLLGTISGCPFHLSEYGDLLYNSELKLTQSPDLQHRMYHVVLLQRKLLILKGQVDNFQFVHSIPVDEMSSNDRARGLYFSISVNRSDKGYSHVYQFKAKNIKIQQNWILKLKEAIEAMKSTLVRNTSRASFGRSGRKLRRMFSFSQHPRSSSVDYNNTDSDEDNVESSKQYWLNRRNAVKKYRSFNTKENGRVKRPATGTVSDSEERGGSAMFNGMAPLAVWNLFPELEAIYIALRDDDTSSPESLKILETKDRAALNDTERKYRNILKVQLDLFKKRVSEPPKEIQICIQSLHKFHSKIFKNLDNGDYSAQNFLDTLTHNGEEFAVIYSEFFIDRCTFYEEMLDLDQRDSCVFPINHFTAYCRLVIKLRREKKFRAELIQTAAEVLHDTITNANNYLLAECINNVPFALSQCEPILLVDRMKMRCDGRSRQEHQFILVKDQLIILDIRPPLYNYNSSLRLDSICLGPSTDKFHFQVEYRTTSTTKKVYSFRASRKEIRDRWIDEIRKILAHQAIRMRDEHKLRLEDAPSFQVGPADNGLLVPFHTVDISKSPHFQKKIHHGCPLETDL